MDSLFWTDNLIDNLCFAERNNVNGEIRVEKSSQNTIKEDMTISEISEAVSCHLVKILESQISTNKDKNIQK